MPVIKRLTQAQLNTLPDGRDIPAYVSQPGLGAGGRFTYDVTCKRRTSPGTLTTQVKANSPEEAMKAVRDGQVPGIGLGWLPLRAVLR